MAKTVFDVLNEQIDEQISSAKVFLAAGSAKDYPNYREVVGLIRGLEASKNFVQDLSRNYMDDNDD
jgi:hypothetical protein